MWLSVPSSFTIFHRSCAAFYHIKSSLHSPCHCALSSLYLREYIYSYLEPFFLPFVSKIFLFLKIYYYQIFLQIRIDFSKGHNGVEARTPKTRTGNRFLISPFAFTGEYISIKGCRGERNRCTKWPYRFCFLLQFIATRPLLAETNDFHRLMNRSR